MQKTISIVGCGWLGLPLGRFLSDKGFLVKGSTTNPEKIRLLEKNSIQPFQLSLNPEPSGNDWERFLDSEIIIINIPPQIAKKGSEFHIHQIQNLIEKLTFYPKKDIIFISSTSVYPELNKEMDELSEVINDHPLITVEKIIQEKYKKVTILRCAGLMGYDRIPGKYFAGKQNLTTGDIPVNFVHRDDVVKIVFEVVQQQKWNTVYNVVAPEHPIRKDIYLKNCIDFGFELPSFAKNHPLEDFKIINGEKLIKDLDYNFLYPNPLRFKYEMLM